MQDPQGQGPHVIQFYITNARSGTEKVLNRYLGKEGNGRKKEERGKGGKKRAKYLLEKKVKIKL